MADSIPLRELYPGRSILMDCWEAAESFRSLVPRHFKDPGAFQEQAELVRRRGYDRGTLVTVMREQNERFSAGPRTRQNIERLADPRSLVVIGGQQAGLFGGPLYTLNKALTILALAAHLESALDCPVVPVFWIASEDSDLAEVNRAFALDSGGRLQEIPLELSLTENLPVSRIALGGGIDDALAALDAALAGSQFASPVMARLRKAYSPGSTFPHAFGTWMQHCLSDRGIAMVDPSDRRLKLAASSLFRGEIEEDGPVARAVIRQTERLAVRGYPAQIELREGMLTLFYQDPARQAIVVSPDGFQLKGDSRRLSRAEMLAVLEEHPEKLTPNAALRPLFQDTLFPTAAVVLGPAELAYFSQLTEAYQQTGIPMPVLFPRASLTIIEPKVGKLLDRLGPTLADVASRKEKLLDDLARKEVPPSLFQRLSQAKDEVAAIWGGVIDEVGSFEQTLRPTARNAAGRSRKQFDFMERKIIKAAKRKDEVLRARIERIIASLYPRNGLQERTLCLPPFLARYGEAVIDSIYRRIDPFAAEHRAVRLPE